MTGSGLAAILVPIAGTIFLATWLALVFYAGHPRRAPNPAPGRESPGPAALADRRQSGALYGCSQDKPRTRHWSWVGTDSGRPG